jgi:hypothetical protein
MPTADSTPSQPRRPGFQPETDTSCLIYLINYALPQRKLAAGKIPISSQGEPLSYATMGAGHSGLWRLPKSPPGISETPPISEKESIVQDWTAAGATRKALMLITQRSL